jgi:hypothetical protein
MKTLKTSLFAFAAALIFNSCTPSAEEARVYNDELISLENPLSEKENSFIEQLSGDKTPDKIKSAYDDLLKQSNETMTDIEKIKGFDNSTTYLDAAKEYFTAIKGLVDNEYKVMAELASKNPEEITDEDSKKYDDLAAAVEEKSKKVLEKVQSEQEAFASKYKFSVEKSEQ